MRVRVIYSGEEYIYESDVINLGSLLSFDYFVNMFDCHPRDDVEKMEDVDILMPSSLSELREDLGMEDLRGIVERVFELSFLNSELWKMDEELMKNYIGCDKESYLQSLGYGKNLLKLWESEKIEEMRRIGEIECENYGELGSKEEIERIFLDIVVVDYFDNDRLLSRLIKMLYLYGIREDEENDE